MRDPFDDDESVTFVCCGTITQRGRAGRVVSMMIALLLERLCVEEISGRVRSAFLCVEVSLMEAVSFGNLREPVPT